MAYAYRYSRASPDITVWLNVPIPSTFRRVGIRTNVHLSSDWNHFAFVVDRAAVDELRFYLNGSLTSSRTVVLDGASLDSGRPLTLNATGAPAGDPTLVDEFTIYRRALDASEIQAIVDAGPAGKEGP